MKLFIVNLGGMRRDQIDVARELKKHHEIQYWVRIVDQVPLDEKEFPGTIFHDYLDALAGRAPAGFSVTDFEPWSAERIADFAPIESEYMTMADKLYPQWSVNRRKDLFYDLLRYWDGILGTLQPDCIVMLSVPHEMYNFVLYELAKRRGIRTLLLDDTPMDSTRYVLIEDYKAGSKRLANTQGSRGSLSALSPNMRAYYERVSRSDNPSPPLMISFNRVHTPFHKVRRFMRACAVFVRDGSIFERAVMKMFKLMRPSLKDEHRIYQSHADMTRAFVYLPLHYQPELTTSPLAGVYVNQLLAVKTIAAALPRGWELYVKEHPAQVGVHGGNETPARYKGFYKAIAETPHVRLIPLDTNTFELIDHARATAVATGTAGWESVVRGRPAIVFGYPWYMHAPGVLRIASVEECREAFRRVEGGYLPDKEELFAFLEEFDRIGVPDPLYKEVSDGKGAAERMYRVIANALNEKDAESRISA